MGRQISNMRTDRREEYLIYEFNNLINHGIDR